MTTDKLLQMWLLVFDSNNQMAHATMDGRPLLFLTRRLARKAVKQFKKEGIKARPMQVEAFLRAGYSLEPQDKFLDPATLRGETP